MVEFEWNMTCTFSHMFHSLLHKSSVILHDVNGTHLSLPTPLQKPGGWLTDIKSFTVIKLLLRISVCWRNSSWVTLSTLVAEEKEVKPIPSYHWQFPSCYLFSSRFIHFFHSQNPLCLKYILKYSGRISKVQSTGDFFLQLIMNVYLHLFIYLFILIMFCN